MRPSAGNPAAHQRNAGEGNAKYIGKETVKINSSPARALCVDPGLGKGRKKFIGQRAGKPGLLYCAHPAIKVRVGSVGWEYDDESLESADGRRYFVGLARKYIKRQAAKASCASET